jgi:hypothetical protein
MLYKLYKENIMGLSPFSSWSSDGGKTIVNVNPDPKNFEIQYTEYLKPYLIAKIKYPNCTNFKGIKILVFKGITEKQLRNRLIIDPHFDKDSKFSPIARFEPTDRGIEMCVYVVNILSKNEI